MHNEQRRPLRHMQLLRHVYLPASLPFLTAALRVGFAQAWRALVAAEMIGASQGIGWMVAMGGQIGNSSQVLFGRLDHRPDRVAHGEPGFSTHGAPLRELARTMTRPFVTQTFDPRLQAGAYSAPDGFYERVKALPFLGRLSCGRTTLTAGEWTELTLTYEVGASPSPTAPG